MRKKINSRLVQFDDLEVFWNPIVYRRRPSLFLFKKCNVWKGRTDGDSYTYVCDRAKFTGGISPGWGSHFTVMANWDVFKWLYAFTVLVVSNSPKKHTFPSHFLLLIISTATTFTANLLSVVIFSKYLYFFYVHSIFLSFKILYSKLIHIFLELFKIKWLVSIWVQLKCILSFPRNSILYILSIVHYAPPYT